MLGPLQSVIAAVGAVTALIGLLLVAGGAVGVLRFPDFYTRLHGASAAIGPGAVLVLLGLAALASDAGLALRLVSLAMLAAIGAPLINHALASAAHGGGLAPLAGDYTAPRPGPQRARDGAG